MCDCMSVNFILHVRKIYFNCLFCKLHVNCMFRIPNQSEFILTVNFKKWVHVKTARIAYHV